MVTTVHSRLTKNACRPRSVWADANELWIPKAKKWKQQKEGRGKKTKKKGNRDEGRRLFPTSSATTESAVGTRWIIHVCSSSDRFRVRRERERNSAWRATASDPEICGWVHDNENRQQMEIPFVYLPSGRSCVRDLGAFRTRVPTRARDSAWSSESHAHSRFWPRKLGNVNTLALHTRSFSISADRRTYTHTRKGISRFIWSITRRSALIVVVVVNQRRPSPLAKCD